MEWSGKSKQNKALLLSFDTAVFGHGRPLQGQADEPLQAGST
jgi:hypothetical protein